MANFVADKSPDFLQQLLGSLQPLAQQDTAYRNNQHMNKVFAANPAFAQALYSAQNDQRTLGLQEEEIMRKRKQQEALKALAGQLQGQPLDRQKALTQYGMITGDLEPLLGVGSGSLPAPIQIANEIARRRASGDIEGAKLLELSAKLGEKGTYTDPLTGEVKVIPGYAPSIATIEGAKADAGNISDMTYDPQTAGLSEAQKLAQQLKTEPAIARAKNAAGVEGTSTGEAAAKLQSMEAGMPAVEQVVTKLSGLGKLATYTMAGQTRDAIMRQIGMDVPDSAVARKEYMSTVDNEVLPLLKQTFGAAFTVQEGESLRKTLGDPNASPTEKDAVLKSFIDAKRREVETLKRQVGETAAPIETPRQRLERLRAERGGVAP